MRHDQSTTVNVRGTYYHPMIFLALAMWCSEEFYVKAAIVLRDYFGRDSNRREQFRLLFYFQKLNRNEIELRNNTRGWIDAASFCHEYRNLCLHSFLKHKSYDTLFSKIEGQLSLHPVEVRESLMNEPRMLRGVYFHPLLFLPLAHWIGKEFYVDWFRFVFSIFLNDDDDNDRDVIFTSISRLIPENCCNDNDDNVTITQEHCSKDIVTKRENPEPSFDWLQATDTVCEQIHQVRQVFEDLKFITTDFWTEKPALSPSNTISVGTSGSSNIIFNILIITNREGMYYGYRFKSANINTVVGLPMFRDKDVCIKLWFVSDSSVKTNDALEFVTEKRITNLSGSSNDLDDRVLQSVFNLSGLYELDIWFIQKALDLLKKGGTRIKIHKARCEFNTHIGQQTSRIAIEAYSQIRDYAIQAAPDRSTPNS